MPQIHPWDIIAELSELTHDLVAEIRMQLNFHRASVYKEETSKQIISRVEKLKLIGELTKYDQFLEAIRDYEAEKELGASANGPSGECPLASRTARFISAVEQCAAQMAKETSQDDSPWMPPALEREVQRHRRELMTACRAGSRSRFFFQNF